ncbi:ATP-binding protein [Perlabentimonas gracilis]|uniref:ATP-binding protein n=1 Tax=Perlabentimonas gracilis TaxID=2715279 RepID=UPI00140B14D0|nr:ATP-binding protein [Perlabentimonas gracilis]NHB69692.1 PAS domain S-box protein [Perlabentimonas gracilis]
MDSAKGIPDEVARELKLLREENTRLRSIVETSESPNSSALHAEPLINLQKENAELEKKLSNNQLLIENAFDGVFLMRGRHFTYVNSRFCSITGYSEDELIGPTIAFIDLIADRSKKFVEQVFESREKGNTNAVRYEIGLKTKSGEEKIVELASVPVVSSDAIMLMGIIKDNTKRRKMEQEIKRHTRIQSLLMNLSIRFINIPYDNIKQEVDHALSDIGEFASVDRVYIFAYDWNASTMSNTHEWCAQGIEPVIDTLQELPTSIVPSWIEAHIKGKPIHIPSVAELNNDDNVKTLLTEQKVKSIITIPMMFENQCMGFVGFDSVINIKHWNEQEISLLRLFAELLVNVQIKANYDKWLKEAKTMAEIRQAEIRNIIDFSPVGIVHLSLSGEILEINQAALNIIDAPSIDDIKSKNIFGRRALEKIGLIDNFRKCIATKSMVSKETKYSSTWGKASYVRYSLIPIITDNTVQSVLANVEDISSIKETEYKLISLKERAEASDKLKTAFLANMSHEIRTPMNAICGFSNLLLEDNVTEEQKKEFVEIINLNGHQLLGIINDIVDISKIESGQVTISKAKFSVNSMLNDLKSVFSQTARIRGLELICTLGLTDSESIIFTDEVKLSQILNNLIFNAIKFTQTGEVEVGYRLQGRNLEFFVRDTGIGIEPEQGSLIFERFQQVDNTTNSSRKGTGLGLPISKAFVEMLGGKIWFQSTPNVGTIFYFTIPYIKGLSVEGEKSAPAVENFIWPDKTFLVAEDDDPNYQYLEHLLTPTKAKVIRAHNGKQAVEICLTEKIDLILMDIKMPTMNGIEATKEIRSQGVTTPIIAQTAYAFQEDRENALRSGCNHYATKPIESAELFSMIHSLLQPK